jgi:hypothetical protein
MKTLGGKSDIGFGQSHGVGQMQKGGVRKVD